MNGVMSRGPGGSIVQQTVDTSSLVWPVCQTATTTPESCRSTPCLKESNITFFIRIVVLCVLILFYFLGFETQVMASH